MSDPVDKLIDELDGSIDLHPAPEGPPELSLDEEDTELLLYDCHEFISAVLEVARTKWQINQANELLARLDSVLSWHRIQ